MTRQTSTVEHTVQAAREFLDGHVGEPVSLARLAGAVGASPWHLQRIFKRVLGVSPKAYHRTKQRERLKQALRQPGATVNQATYATGVGSPGRVYARAGAELGMTPGAYRRGAAGETICYSVATTAVGRVLVAATARGVAFVTLGDHDKTLVTALEHEFPRAEIERDDHALKQHMLAIREAVESGESVKNVPIDPHGTDFQLKVWRALRQIPAGVTRTYTEIAEQIGQPSAVRAVARACATNPVSLVVPCHRVVRQDGSLAGYRWGVERKRELLKREGAKD